MLPPASIAATTLLFVVACCLSDFRTRTIPNVLTGSALLIGLALNGILYGGWGILAGVAGAVLCLALLLAPFALGGVGGGDVKMMSAVGALLGPRLALNGLAIGLILGGILMVCHLARIGRLGEKLAATWSMARRSVVEHSVEAWKVSDADPGTVALPYSLPLGAGTLLVMVFSWSNALLSGGIR